MPNIGPLELLIVLGIVILILGPKRIPAAARSVGRGLRDFRDEVGGGKGKDKTRTSPIRRRSPSKSKSETKT